MDFAWIGEYYVNVFEELINKEHGKFAGKPVICAGDYADEEPTAYNGEKQNLYDLSQELETDVKPDALGDIRTKHYRYAINEDKKEFVDCEKMALCGYQGKHQIHPLPLLIADGNGRGGGDYSGKGERLVGKWKRNVVVVSDNKPDETYKEIKVPFKEDW